MLIAAAACSITACGDSRDPEEAGAALIEAINDGSVSATDDLFARQPSAAQLDTLDAVRDGCSFGPESTLILPSGVTPQLERFFAVADCGGQKRLLGATLTIEGQGLDTEDQFFRVSPDFLPGGDSAGKFSRDGLPRDWADLEALGSR